MKTTKVQAKFPALLDAFDPISGQPTDKDLTRLHQVALSALVPIPYDRENRKHFLLGLLLNDDEYRARHKDVEFPSDAATRPLIYDDTIQADAIVGVRAQAEAIYQAKLDNWKFFDCAQREMRNFIAYSVEAQAYSP